MVRSEAMKMRRQLLNELAVIKRPAWIPMKHNHGFAISFIYIVVPVSTNGFKMVFKRIKIRAYSFHNN
jgi:hypothetical protein